MSFKVEVILTSAADIFLGLFYLIDWKKEKHATPPALLWRIAIRIITMIFSNISWPSGSPLQIFAAQRLSLSSVLASVPHHYYRHLLASSALLRLLTSLRTLNCPHTSFFWNVLQSEMHKGMNIKKLKDLGFTSSTKKWKLKKILFEFIYLLIFISSHICLIKVVLILQAMKNNKMPLVFDKILIF